MKKYMIRIATVLLGISALFSCDDMLNWTPETELASESFWKSANDCKLYTNSYYDLFITNYRKSTALTLGMFEGDMNSDNAVKGGYSGELNGETSAPTAGNGSAGFQFNEISKLNYFLENYTRYTGSFEGIQQYVGETFFFHSLLYFNRVKKFGDFQYTKKVLSIDSPELYLPRLPRNQVVDSILSTLDLAIEYIPVKAKISERRISKEIALLVKSRVALYEGTWEKYHADDDFKVKNADPDKYFRIAAQAVEDLMEIGSCDLDNVGLPMGYNRLFIGTDYTNSKEIMLWRPYQTSFGHAITYTSAGGDNAGATRDLIEAYLRTDGKPIDPANYKDDTFGDIIMDRDPRLIQSIVFPYNIKFAAQTEVFTFPEVTHQQASWRNTTGYQIYKGHDWADKSRAVSQSEFSGVVATIYYRYAEALLNYAEAKAELGEVDQDIIDMTINRLRERAGMPIEGFLQVSNVPNDPRNDWGISPLLYEIRRERRVELAFEGFRMDDLKRWAVMTRVMRDWKPLGIRRVVFEEGTPVTSLVRESLVSNPTVSENGHNILLTFKTIDENGNEIPLTMPKGYLPYDDEEGAITRKFVFDDERNDWYMDPYTSATAPDISLPAGYAMPDKLYLSPVPKVEISLNNRIIQNPGW